MDYLIAFLIQWLVLNTDITIKETPDVVISSTQELSTKFGSPVWALYDHKTSTIYLSTDVDLNTVAGVSVLLHELVHHHQNESGLIEKYSCLRESEKLAYNTQKKFLKSLNYDVSSFKELSAFNIVVKSLCTLY